MPSKANYPAQNAGKPSPDTTRDRWRNSILVGPQLAGIPSVESEGELTSDSATSGSDNFMQPPDADDQTGGALNYFKSQRRK